MPPFKIRFANLDDAETIAGLVRKLAIYERLEHEVVSSPEHFRQALGDPKSSVEILLAEVAGQPVGFALFFPNFSTFLGRPGLYLEDLYVEPEFRRLGIGQAFFAELLRIARDRHYGRVEWAVLDWNAPAIDFYRNKIGADILVDWRVCRLSPGDSPH